MQLFILYINLELLSVLSNIFPMFFNTALVVHVKQICFHKSFKKTFYLLHYFVDNYVMNTL